MRDHQVSAYQTVDTTTADPGRLVVLLLEGAERALRRALHALEQDDVGAFAYSVSRAHAVVGELSGSLNHEAGGEVARNLARLYDFILRHLTAGLIAKRRSHLDQVLGLLAQVREGFEAAVESARRESA